jgi:hypothetical protein
VVEKRSAGSSHSRHKYLNERGADIYIDGNPNTMHHKVIVVDGQLVMTGSYNFQCQRRRKERRKPDHDSQPGNRGDVSGGN